MPKRRSRSRRRKRLRRLNRTSSYPKLDSSICDCDLEEELELKEMLRTRRLTRKTKMIEQPMRQFISLL